MNDRNKYIKVGLLAVLALVAILGAIVLTNRKKVAECPSTATILSTIQQEADLVTTELTIRKIAYYDSSLHEQILISDPSTWKVGERKCIVPVEVKIKYGYDLRDMTLDNVKVNDTLRVIEVTLPQPKIIDSGFNSTVDYDRVVCIATGLRDKVGHETIEKIRQQAYEAVMKDDYQELVGTEIRHNAQTLLNSLAISMGFEGCEVK
ncbi:MAG: DUF4230 domain-containing protein [Bacteroidaceae bacterium]|nr:DUF4230 domain-containing protein [Bacteroidaceae bacterium]